LSERIGLQFRTEVFNLANRVQFAPPGTSLGSAQFGVVSGQCQSRGNSRGLDGRRERECAVRFPAAQAKADNRGRIKREEHLMPGTYKMTELVGTSPVSFTEAVKAAVEEAAQTVRHMDWFDVVKESGRIVNGKVQEFQVTIKVGFKIEH
jgi:flavin-binding protein dodecin